MKMEQTECSETLAYKIRTPENYQEESMEDSEDGESLKSRLIFKFKYSNNQNLATGAVIYALGFTRT